ncbi:hypothetical protein GCM10010259_18400 [Streptomyces daghestanicus]|uniref:Uncharacterized protein n=1 Tax=Streptomyces daghestanicus TaxID=66885 RepID=A0ABQ3Q3P8_9ACTN|nr:hypothetical protein GCM10010259_18400 [Streptomyces daghestanicus]GHI31903.1 hypothetical protein Sdagh_36330 [Streptomyces daghestanicus]
MVRQSPSCVPLFPYVPYGVDVPTSAPRRPHASFEVTAKTLPAFRVVAEAGREIL